MRKTKAKSLKICAGASAGGHLNQLLKLLEFSYLWSSEPAFYVTTLPEVAKKLEKKAKTYVVGECNRQHPLEAIKVFFRGLSLVITERPDVIITTGSMPIAMMCLSAKMAGTKVVWIDSIANTEKFSMSGRLMYHVADLFLTQWPELAQKYPKAQYVGNIL